VPRPSVTAVEDRYSRGTLWAAIVVMGSWHLAAVLPTAIQSMPVSRPPGIGVWLWLGYAVIGVVASIVLLRGGGRTAWLGSVTSPLLLAGVAVVGFTNPSGSLFDRLNWAFSAVGWFALIVLWRRPVWEMAAFFAGNAGVGLAVMVAADEVSRADLSRFISAVYGVTVLQITILVGARALTALAISTASAQASEAEVLTMQLAAERVHRSRRDRYATVSGVAAELLTGLAAGTLNLASVDVQQRLRVAATRLRRLIVESDDVPDALVHELRACADAAERRGVAVDLQAPVGTIPALPLDVRRALAEPLILVLAAIRSHARVTVVAEPADVAVAVVGDAPVDARSPMPHHLVQVNQDTEEGLLWMQARWRDQSRLPS
jgi:hypothetical protein